MTTNDPTNPPDPTALDRIADALERLADPAPGPQGPAGAPGADSTVPGPAGKDSTTAGPQGAAGAAGAAGAKGAAGATGAAGAKGAAGATGATGATGAVGPMGPAGGTGQAPAPPAGVSASDATAGGVTITWAASAGATGYNVNRSTVAGQPGARLAAGVGSPFTDSTAVPGTPYFYSVEAIGPGGTSPPSAQDSGTVPVVPPATFALTVTKVGQGTVTGVATSYPAGTVVNPIATPSPGSMFVGWAGACTGPGACSIKMDRNQSLTATFAPIVAPPATVSWGAIPATFPAAPRGSVGVGAIAKSSDGSALKFTLATGALTGTGATLDPASGSFALAADAKLGTIPALSLLADDLHGHTAISPVFSIDVQAASAIAISPTFPLGFTFDEGVPKRIALAPYFAGAPASVTLNKATIADDVGMEGVSWDPVTRELVFDGSPGIGKADNFVIAATDGANPVHELILPSSLTAPWYGPNEGGPSGKCYGGTDLGPPRSALVASHGNTVQQFFENRLGDWWDASYPPQRQGSVPWYTFTAAANWTGTKTTVNTYDVTQLVQLWQSGEIPNYGFLVKDPTGNSDVYFSSPTAAAGAEGPFLNLTYADGSTETLLAAEASGMSETALGNGTSKNVRWGTSVGICYFNLAGKKRIKKATWTLTAHNTYGACTFKVFALRWEGQPAGEAPAWGIAQNYPDDVGLEAESSVIFVERFKDIDFFTRGGWATLGSSWKQVPLDRYQYIVGDRDPKNPNYRPLKPGIPAIKWVIPAGGNGGKRMDFSFWGLLGSGPNIASTYKDLKRVYVRWYQCYADDFDVRLPEEGGHATGLCGEYIDGTWSGTPLTVLQQTGRYRADPRYFKSTKPMWAAVTNYNAAPDYQTNPMSKAGISLMNAYAYDVGSVGQASGALTNWNAKNTHRGLIQRARWYEFEQMVQVNDPGQANGIIRVWVDARLALDKTDCQMVTDPDDGITNLCVQAYYGGTGLSPNDLSTYMAAMVISHDYIGPARL